MRIFSGLEDLQAELSGLDLFLSVTLLGDLSEKSFKIAQWPKGLFVQPAKTGAVTCEQIVAMFLPLNGLQFESLQNCVLFFKLEL